MKRLFIMRHAIAEDREHFAKTGQPDDDRPLTASGRKKLEKISSCLKDLDLGVSVVIQSPLTRSQQTATILAKNLGGKVRIETLASLRPGSSFAPLVRDLVAFKKNNLLIIGHEDHLSQFAMYLLTGHEHAPFLQFKKSGIASLTYESEIHARKMRLEWLLTPKMILGRGAK